MEDEVVETFDEVGLSRELARKAHPDAVAELIDGNDVETIAASIEPARAAYARLREELSREQPARVPAGGMSPAVDPDRLPAAEKIRRGIAVTKRP